MRHLESKNRVKKFFGKCAPNRSFCSVRIPSSCVTQSKIRSCRSDRFDLRNSEQDMWYEFAYKIWSQSDKQKNCYGNSAGQKLKMCALAHKVKKFKSAKLLIGGSDWAEILWGNYWRVRVPDYRDKIGHGPSKGLTCRVGESLLCLSQMVEIFNSEWRLSPRIPLDREGEGNTFRYTVHWGRCYNAKVMAYALYINMRFLGCKF